MASFTVDITPNPVTKVSEGSLDTSVVGGLSLQRTVECLLVVNGSNRKQLHRLADGEVYDNTTFQTVVPNVVAGNPNFASGTGVSRPAVTSGHPTASVLSGSTL
jgi:hypothetical protein